MRPPTPSLRSRFVAAHRRLFTALPLLLIFFTLFFPSNIEAAANNPVPVSDDLYDEADEETARVVRISFLRGKSWIQRAGAIEWEQATLNLPLVEGDRLATDRDARLELQLDRDNFIRLDRDATLTIVTLRTEGIALSLSEGTLSLRLARFAPAQEYFEIDAPNTTVACERAGLYRLDATNAGGVRLTVRGDGRARLPWHGRQGGRPTSTRDGNRPLLPVTHGGPAADRPLPRRPAPPREGRERAGSTG